MRISLKQFRDQLKDFEFYQDILEYTTIGTVIHIPIRPPEIVYRIKELLHSGKSPGEIRRELKVSINKVCSVRKYINKPFRSDVVYRKLTKKWGVRAWKLIDRFQGCSIYISLNDIRQRNIKHNKIIEECYIQYPRRPVADVAKEVGYTVGYVRWIIRTYLKATNPLYSDQRFKSSYII